MHIALAQVLDEARYLTFELDVEGLDDIATVVAGLPGDNPVYVSVVVHEYAEMGVSGLTSLSARVSRSRNRSWEYQEEKSGIPVGNVGLYVSLPMCVRAELRALTPVRSGERSLRYGL